MVRQDGRGLENLRKINVTKNYIKYAEGSCLIEIGETRLVCTASVEEKVPPFLQDTASGWITAEYGMIPRSCQTRTAREATRKGQSGRTHEIQRLIGRSLRAVVDLEVLGSRTIWIDCDVLQADGGTRTGSITGSFIALAEALNKLKKTCVIDRLPIKDFVAATSVGIIDGTALLDLAYEEDAKADVDMNVVMTASGKFIEIQGTAEGIPFDDDQLAQLLKLAKKGIKEIIKVQKKELPYL